MARQKLGKPPSQWPAGLAQRAINGLWYSRIVNSPASDLDHSRCVCVVDDSRARRELGYAHSDDMDSTL